MKTIIVIPEGGLVEGQLEKLQKCPDVLVIEAKDPACVKMLQPLPLVEPSALLMCALEAIAGPNCAGERAQFALNLTEHLRSQVKAGKGVAR